MKNFDVYGQEVLIAPAHPAAKRSRRALTALAAVVSALLASGGVAAADEDVKPTPPPAPKTIPEPAPPADPPAPAPTPAPAPAPGPAPAPPPVCPTGTAPPCPPPAAPEPAPAPPQTTSPDTRFDLRRIAPPAGGEPRSRQPARSPTGELSPRRPATRERRARSPRESGGAEAQIADAGAPFTAGPLPDWPGALGLGGALAVPDALIDGFRIPPFLLPIYQAAGIEYGIPWQVLAAINEIETDYGRNLNVSSAGAMGWMQFIPSSWRAYGVDANGDGRKDPYNPADAIFAAARYLAAAGAEDDLRRAIFAYNHADWYVESVMLRARLVTALPASLVNAVTGLARGRFPVVGPARWEAAGRAVEVRARPDAPVVAVHDGVVARMGRSEEHGRFLVLRDLQGNSYRYSQLGEFARVYPAPRVRPPRTAPRVRPPRAPRGSGPLTSRPRPEDPDPTGPASAGRQASSEAEPARSPALETATKERLFANPRAAGAMAHGGREQLLRAGAPLERETTFEAELRRTLGAAREHTTLRPLEDGAQVAAGTVLARVSPSVRLSIRPRGRGPRGRAAEPIAAGPILRGWRLLERTAVPRNRRHGGPLGRGARQPTVGQLLLMGEAQLARHVLADDRIEIYGCGRGDVAAGQIDSRVLAALAYLASTGLHPRVTSLRCGHSFMTASGNVSEHSSGNAVDIAAINGTPILGHQGPGSIADVTVRRLLELQGALEPHQVISLMGYERGDIAVAMGDHADHIHVGFDPDPGASGDAGTLLGARQWRRLSDRLGEIDNPVLAGHRN